MRTNGPRAWLVGLSLLLMAVSAATADGEEAAMAANDEARDTFKAMEGSWVGTVRTWFEPGKLADESKVTGSIRPILGGLFHRHEYESTIQGKPRHGEETWAFNSVTHRFQTSWVDDFHMNYALMSCEGTASPRGFTVAGKYDYPGVPQWTWRTVYELVDADHLTITAYNITPEGQEALAVETRYARVK